MIAAIRCMGGLAPEARRSISQLLADHPSPIPAHAAIRNFECWGAKLDPGNIGATLFFGRIDNFRDTAHALGLSPESTPVEIYSRALGHWGDEADRKLVGHYSAITLEGPNQLRLVRSPWTAPPLHFVAGQEITGASPLLSALFAAGVEKRIDWDHLVDQLAFDHHDCEPVGWYKGIGRVPLGSRIRIDGSDWTLDRYYDPVATEPVCFDRDEDYVERAQELLDEAARVALTGVEKPAIMLSGGLDSPLAAAALLREMPEGATLHSFTFGPIPEWDGYSPPGTFGEERERVRRFAAMHPQIEPHFPDPVAGGHDHRLRDLLARTEIGTANVANIGIFHSLFEQAKAAGCDAMLTALHGNFTISLDAGWAAAEALRSGRLAKVRRLLAASAEDEEAHSILRRFLSQAVLPNLPESVQRAVRQQVHPERSAPVPLASLLSAGTANAWRKRSTKRGSRTVFERPTIPASREEAIRRMWASADSGEDIDLGMERLHGMAHRDVTAYRPLFEFCHGLPTDQLRRAHVDRFLARRMARGMMPEEQRLETRQGRHNVDWHARMTGRRSELLVQVSALRAHPELSRILDLDRLDRLLVDWPEEMPRALEDRIPREIGITRALTTAAFVSHVEKRNDF
ncbi:asparagine synthase-related protein [Qipengyuania vesicularis]|uniref:asparagine synthase-related protein n=1 Tax=Qipengyuania vesicularis TaxID=2867232 RepID=UPI001C88BC21|nr:asparagine synthase-related protein [Qipengyuania vesicularis]MBX7528154.1 hypothetical protein [Qipengyuania vesicularis]